MLLRMCPLIHTKVYRSYISIRMSADVMQYFLGASPFAPDMWTLNASIFSAQLNDYSSVRNRPIVAVVNDDVAWLRSL